MITNPGTVVQEMQAGWMIKDRLLRRGDGGSGEAQTGLVPALRRAACSAVRDEWWKHRIPAFPLRKSTRIYGDTQ